ncbi:SEC-C domain-containing protein [Candidatus Woesearchaeota archaeon]|nr:SEC-C domain-containing protein [Candidatus Woesearchaeota archaeon]
MSEVINYKGRLEVELEIPISSCLSNKDIKNVLRIASWDGDVNDIVKELDGGYEGNRSVLIPREFSFRNLQGVEINTLQISGVGYFTTETKGPSFYLGDDACFKPPVVDNIMLVLDKNVMRTTCVENNGFGIERSDYKPTGAYEQSNLKKKVDATNLASDLELELLSVPRIEAVGRFPGLLHEGKPLGFLVYGVPEKPRFAQDVDRMFKTMASNGEVPFIVVAGIYSMTFGCVLPRLAVGLRELHDKGFVHRQPHGANFYYFKENDQVMLMDWETVVRDGSDSNVNILNRVIDLNIVHNVYDKMYRVLFDDSDIQHHLAALSGHVLSMILYAYAGNAPEFFTFFENIPRGRDDSVMQQWLLYMQNIPVRKAREFDAEGFADGWSSAVAKIVVNNARDNSEKVSRNASCPCGSGRKFKKCCGA